MGGGGPGGGGEGGEGGGGSDTNVKVYELVMELTNPELRASALLELSKKRDSVSDLAPVLWHSFGTIAALLQEIVSIYPLLSPPALTAHASNRVCNALALLQCVASHPETRGYFLTAHIPLFLYPFLNTVSKTRPFEYLRLTSLGNGFPNSTPRPKTSHLLNRDPQHACTLSKFCHLSLCLSISK